VRRDRPGWLAARLFELTLFAYPRAFRARFGDEMRADFRRNALGIPGTLGTLLTNGLRERVAAIARWSFWPSHKPHLYEPTRSRSMRLARKAPATTGLAVAALALGIGANSAIFTVVYSVLLRPLPYTDPARLAMVWSHNTKEDKPSNPISPADYADLQDQGKSLVTLEGYFSFMTNSQLIVDGQSEIAITNSVTPGLFAMLGRGAALGRALNPDDLDGRLVLSDGFWRRRFGADPSVVGRDVIVDGQPFTIVGVMPPDFSFPYKGMLGPTGFIRSLNADFWVPLQSRGPQFVSQSGQLVRAVHFLAAVGRLQPGVSVEQARAGLATIASQLETAYPDTNNGWTTTVLPLHEQVVGEVRPALLVLLGGVALILVMACVNVANLVLARSVARHKELAVRAALGASRGRLATQALVESLILALAGGAMGLLVVTWGVQALVALAPANLPRLQEASPDLTVLGVTVLVALLTGTLVGIVPALVAGRADLHRALQDVSRGMVGSASRHRLRSGLVIAEVALAVVLTVGAGLLLRSFDKLLGVDAGFRSANLLTLQMNIPRHLTTPDARRAFYATFFERMEAIPGVVSVGGTTRIPLGSTNVTTTIEVEGRATPANERPEVEFRRAMHDYFTAMGIPLVRGRTFTAEDGPAAPPVALINQAMARRVFPNEEAVGRHVRLGPNPSGPWTTIVGVIGDVHHSSLETEPAPELYINYLQNPPVAPFIAIQTAGDPAALADLVRAEARAIDPSLTLYDIRTMEQIRAESVAERRFLLLLIGVFGMLALVLASVGVYGVMSLVVSERTQEVGVRLALGAQPSEVLAMIIGYAVRVSGLGVAAGLVAAAALGPLMASQLFGVSAIDPVTFAAVPALLVLVATLAALVPARRAMRVDPMTALRYE
jgi:putative ABC transport system permease protein